MKGALLTGITGKNGSYRAELLLEKGYEVHGTIRRTSAFNPPQIRHPQIFKQRLFLHLADSASLKHLPGKMAPGEIYSLASLDGSVREKAPTA